MQTSFYILPSPVGNLSIQIQNHKLARIDFVSARADTTIPPEPTCQRVQQELLAYFQQPDHHFNLDLHLEGTPFQKRVWQALQQITPGSTVSYQQLAAQLQTSPRAVGNACRANPIPIVIHCHRIVAKHHIGGYGGDTQGTKIQTKQWLLAHENVILSKNLRVES